MLVKIKSLFADFSRKNIFADYTSFLIFSAFIGIIVGFAVVLFHNLVEILNILLQNLNNNFQSSISPIIIILIPTIGMMIQGILINYFPDSMNSRGITEIIKFNFNIRKEIPLKSTLLNFLASTVSLGTGSTLGPEAPAAFLGGGISNKFSFLFNLSNERKKLITASGAGAAISAIFNTPLAGVFFALEIILLNDFHTTIFSSLIISSISASIVSRTFLGENPIFTINIQDTIKFSHIYLFAILGLLSGLMSYLFHKYLGFTKKFFSKIYNQNFSVLVVMSIIGILIGICGFFYPDIFGIGYLSINKVLNIELTIVTVIVLFILKFVLVPIVYNSGAFGGLFAPSLFLGAMFGFIFQYIILNYFGINLDVASVILISMGAFLAGIHSIPITAILMIFELTQNYSFILPLMMATVISSLVMHIIFKKSIYLTQIESDFDLDQKDPISLILSKISIKDFSLRKILVINENEPLEIVVKKLLKDKNKQIFIVDSKNKVSGFINENNINSVLTDFNFTKNIFVAKDISIPVRYFVKDDDSLLNVFKLMNRYGHNEILVVDSNSEYPLGIISYSDIQKVINDEHFKNNLSRNISLEFSKLEDSSKINVFDDYYILEKKVPKSFINKNLISLDFRKKYNLEVILIKKEILLDNNIRKIEVIEDIANHIFCENDSIVIFGKENYINEIEKIK